MVNYGIKFLLTIPIWWLFFRLLADWPLKKKLPLHLLTFPIFAFTFRSVFYQVCEWLDLGHLGETSSFWDIYIPSLFYFLQFGIYHTYDFYHRFKREQLLQSEFKNDQGKPISP